MRAKLLIITILGVATLLTACSTGDTLEQSSEPISSEASSEISSELTSSEVSSLTSSKLVPSELPSSKETSSKTSEAPSSKEVKKKIELFEPITFRIVDKNNKPVLNAKAEINETTYSRYHTSSSGEFVVKYYPNTVLEPITTGKHVASIELNILSDAPYVEEVDFTLTKDSYKSVVILQVKGEVSNEETFTAPERVEIVATDTNGNPVKDLRVFFAYVVPHTETDAKKDHFVAYTNEDGRVAFVGANPKRRYGLGFMYDIEEAVAITCTMPDGTIEAINMRYYEQEGYWSGTIGGEMEPIYISADSGVTTFYATVDIAR